MEMIGTHVNMATRISKATENNTILNSQNEHRAFVRFTKNTSTQRESTSKSVQKTRPLLQLSRYLVDTYAKCSPGFQYTSALNPRRVLTKPSEGVANDNYDNVNADYILYVNDIIGSYSKHQYRVLDMLGQGTFGQVVKCENIDTKEHVALKIVKNKPAYFNQGLLEIQIVEMLNHRFDAENQHHIVRLKDYFVFRNHLCLIFELLSINLYELIKQNGFRGLSLTLIRCFMILLLDALSVMHNANVIHCDLKPENILLENLTSPSIKIIDFGSACFENHTVYSYIQSRFYRSPEVLVGVPYDSAIDMWSLGCISAELFLGLPLFPGTSEYNQLYRIIDMLGILPDSMLDAGTKSSKFFDKVSSRDSKRGFKYQLKSEEAYSRETGVTLNPSKKYFKYKTLPEIIDHYAMKEGLSPAEIQKEKYNRKVFAHFLQGLLRLDKDERWTPEQAKTHPFITGKPFTEEFEPEPKKRSSVPHSVPRIIPWGIHNAFLQQRPVSMSFPDHVMEPESFNSAADFTPQSWTPQDFFTNYGKLQASAQAMGGNGSLQSNGPPMVIGSAPNQVLIGSVGNSTMSPIMNGMVIPNQMQMGMQTHHPNGPQVRPIPLSGATQFHNNNVYGFLNISPRQYQPTHQMSPHQMGYMPPLMHSGSYGMGTPPQSIPKTRRARSKSDISPKKDHMFIPKFAVQASLSSTPTGEKHRSPRGRSSSGSSTATDNKSNFNHVNDKRRTTSEDGRKRARSWNNANVPNNNPNNGNNAANNNLKFVPKHPDSTSPVERHRPRANDMKRADGSPFEAALSDSNSSETEENDDLLFPFETGSSESSPSLTSSMASLSLNNSKPPSQSPPPQMSRRNGMVNGNSKFDVYAKPFKPKMNNDNNKRQGEYRERKNT